MCDMCNIYMNYIYIYIREKGRVTILFCYVFLFGTEEENVLHERSLQSTHSFLGVGKEESIEPEVSLLHELNASLNIKRTQE